MQNAKQTRKGYYEKHTSEIEEYCKEENIKDELQKQIFSKFDALYEIFNNDYPEDEKKIGFPGYFGVIKNSSFAPLKWIPAFAGMTAS